MRIRVIIAAILAVLAAVPVAAGAKPHHPNYKARSARLERVVHLLQRKVYTVSAQRDAANAKLAVDAAQIASLQSTVVQLTQQRDAARTQVATLQAQLASIPTPLTVAIQQVQHEVTWAKGGSRYSVDELTALSALNYVVGHVSVGEYGYLEIEGLPLPAHTPNAVLGAQAGICGETSLAFAAIMQHLGYQARRITFYWTLANGTPDGHTAVEVYYGGSWHYFDPTFGQYWTDANGNIMSITDARNGGGTRHKDDVAFTNLIEDPWFAGDDTSFETDPSTTVVVGGDPFVG
jgi:Transglutaminase-like superfamily